MMVDMLLFQLNKVFKATVWNFKFYKDIKTHLKFQDIMGKIFLLTIKSSQIFIQSKNNHLKDRKHYLM